MNLQHTITRESKNAASEQQHAADWYALRLLSNYRLFLLICITALFYLNPNPSVLAQSNQGLFHGALIAYLIAGVIFNHLIRIEKPDHDTQFYLQAYADIVCITLLMHASGGIQSGLGILLVANIAIIGIFSIARYTFLFAAIATTAVLAQEIYTNMSVSTASTSFVKTGFTGMALFAVAYITSIVIQKKFPYRSDNDSLLKDVYRAEELNQRIIQQMDSGILVIDEEWRVQLINDSALVLLGLGKKPKKEVLSELSPQLQTAFLTWKRSPFTGIKPFKNASNDSELLPHFSALGNRGTLISIEDYGVIAQQVQKLKLASLGSLTASIAHEIRNPLSAISNSVQLVSESDSVEPEDKHLLSIAERHCVRINRIIEDILQLSRRDKNNPETIILEPYLNEFSKRFSENSIDRSCDISIHVQTDLSIEFDRSHLEQILSNLCMNSITHNPQVENLKIEIACGVTQPRGYTFISIKDSGVGIDTAITDDIFEPFYTTRHGGTGLGLFIIRELCEINNSQINYCAEEKGACFKLLIANTVK